MSMARDEDQIVSHSDEAASLLQRRHSYHGVALTPLYGWEPEGTIQPLQRYPTLSSIALNPNVVNSETRSMIPTVPLSPLDAMPDSTPPVATVANRLTKLFAEQLRPGASKEVFFDKREQDPMNRMALHGQFTEF
eukprot:comp7177_c0_seq1/m.2896 comp7177_c0_seq1/g.2896  ORF comp7177_c0_seq1/g.2896 comp7177_c0_seq1/m.2896 type:complete len:135 (-) comp7177_c0_seq1:141-545(-)